MRISDKCCIKVDKCFIRVSGVLRGLLHLIQSDFSKKNEFQIFININSQKLAAILG